MKSQRENKGKENRHMEAGNSHHMADAGQAQGGRSFIVHVLPLTQQQSLGKGRRIFVETFVQSGQNILTHHRRAAVPGHFHRLAHLGIRRLIGRQEQSPALAVNVTGRDCMEFKVAADDIAGLQENFSVEVGPDLAGLAVYSDQTIHGHAVACLIAVVQTLDLQFLRLAVQFVHGIQIHRGIDLIPAESHRKAQKNGAQSSQPAVFLTQCKTNGAGGAEAHAGGDGLRLHPKEGADQAGSQKSHGKPHQFAHIRSSFRIVKRALPQWQRP